MEYFLFPKTTYYLTQGYGKKSYSHQNRIALDVSGRNGSKKIYAPFTGYVGKVYVKKGSTYTIWLVSNEKVICANGKKYYAVAMFSHPSEIANYKVGDTFKQWDYLFDDGDTGEATGKHLDFSVAVYDNKKDIKIGWFFNGQDYSLYNSVDPCDYMVLKNDTKVLKDTYLNKKYRFKTIAEVEERQDEEYTVGLYQTLFNVKVRTGPGINYRQKRVEELTADGRKNATSSNKKSPAVYKKGTYFDVLEIITNDKTEVWAKSRSGYVNITIDGYVNCKKV